MSTVGSHTQLNRNVRAGNNTLSMLVPQDKKECAIKVTPQKVQSQVTPQKAKVISYVDDFEKTSFLEPPADTRTTVQEEIEKLQYPAKFSRMHQKMDEIQNQISNLYITEQLEIFKKQFNQENEDLRQQMERLHRDKDKDKDSIKQLDMRLNFIQTKIKEEQDTMQDKLD